MAFTNFKNIAQVQTAYQIEHRREANIILAQPYQPSPSFSHTFNTLLANIDVYSSEEMRKNAVIFPMLAEVYQHHTANLVLWSQEYITVPNDPQLNGYPDFLISARSPLGFTILETPLLIVVEAKEDNFTQGWGQCLAAMVAAQQLNETTAMTVFGIVTNGQMWQFGQLKQQVFEQQETAISRADAFGYLQAIFAGAEKEIRPDPDK